MQVRVALLALLDVKQREIIDLPMLKSSILYLENFHFAYNAVLSSRANRLEKIYSSFAIAIRKCQSKNDAKTTIKTKLFEPLDALFPTQQEFCQKFIELTFSKKDNFTNVKTKYAINKLYCHFSQKEIFPDDGSVEHILSEESGDSSLNIGNLILLEVPLNKEADNEPYCNKIKIYRKSVYPWVSDFIDAHDEWDESMILGRAKKLSDIYYEKILGKKIV